MKTNGQRKKRNIRTFLALAIATLVFTCLVGGVLAKYVEKEHKNASVTAKEFYFESDLLKEGGKEYTLNATTTSLSFSLKNYADELRVAEMEISYTVTVENLTVDYNGGDKKLSAENKDTEKITLTGFEKGKTYTVKAVGNGGYSKTLSATFTVRTEDTGFYKYIEIKEENCLYLTVWTGNVLGTVTFEIPSGLIPDRRLEIFKDFTGNTVSFELDAFSSQLFKFIIPNDYEGEKNFDFDVKLNSSIDALVALPTS